MDQAEQLRNVIKLKNQVPSGKARLIAITSGKGGVGKSNVAVNLAIQLQKLGKKVVVFDADLGLANVEVMFGAIPKYNLGDMIYRGIDLAQIITPGPLGIGFISGGSGIMEMNNLSKDKINYLVRNLSQLDSIADIVIVDTGAGIADSVMEFVLAAPEILLVTTPEPSSLTDSYSLLKALHRRPNFRWSSTQINVIVNKVTSTQEGQAIYDKLDAVVRQFLQGKLNYLGMIPQDTALEKAVRQQKTVSIYAPGSKATKAFEILASNLMNGGHEVPLMRRGISQLFAGLINNR
ncbi:MAG: MinD/ParA family protein [Lachnospiraceae bacterium]|nr:MinD/ParA family protein [Lachnospiraceae bacterium]